MSYDVYVSSRNGIDSMGRDNVREIFHRYGFDIGENDEIVFPEPHDSELYTEISGVGKCKFLTFERPASPAVWRVMFDLLNECGAVAFNSADDHAVASPEAAVALRAELEAQLEGEWTVRVVNSSKELHDAI
ncbi:hypothetical protein [Nocardia sp. NPDC052566]|uniref:hypothetical protein n=1 Tax=Nocardia sp. NPDC052566 TaxID=3364330 RepID=UPI0037CA0435